MNTGRRRPPTAVKLGIAKALECRQDGGRSREKKQRGSPEHCWLHDPQSRSQFPLCEIGIKFQLPNADSKRQEDLCEFRASLVYIASPRKQGLDNETLSQN